MEQTEVSLLEEGEPPSSNIFHVSESKWNSWKWQLSNRIVGLDKLSKYLDLNEDELNFFKFSKVVLPFSITPYYLSLVLKSESLRKAVIPSSKEFIRSYGESEDPLNEEGTSPVEGIVHRYPDRVLFLATGFCSVNCRYCTRSRVVGGGYCYDWGKGLNYIREHKEIRDVVVSGGDPLTMSDEKIGYLLSRIREIKHIEIIRIGTKVPAVMPQRITKGLCKVLKKYRPLFMSIHFTHADELTKECFEACNRLAAAGIPLGSQTVLLKGVNDSVEVMKRLMQGLLKASVRPYYLYQCDPIIGSGHFRTSVEKGLEIIQGLRGWTSGYAVPAYVIDAPGGGGKIPLLPEYLIEMGKEVRLRNFEGKEFKYCNE